MTLPPEARRARSGTEPMASTSDPVVVILDDEPSPGLEKEVPRRLSEAGASASHAAAERRRKQKRKLTPQTPSPAEVVDLTSTSPPRKAVSPALQIVSTAKKPKVPRVVPSSFAPRTTLPDVYIAESRRTPPDPPKSNAPECRICMSAMQEPVATPCGHVFCHVCLTTAMRVKKQCPVCRKAIRSMKQVKRLFL